MHIELVEALRCPRPHAPTWLVARMDEMDGRRILRGALGCHACGAEHPIAGGEADLTLGEPAGGAAPLSWDVAESAMRAAALLDLSTPGGAAMLAGGWAAAAPALSALVEGVHLLALDAPAGVAWAERVSLARAAAALPLRPGSWRGIALDAPHASAAQLEAAAEALRPGGRLVAPAEAPVPEAVTLLARDELLWVAERHTAARIVPLDVRRG